MSETPEHPDQEPGAADTEKGRLLFAQPCRFLLGAVSLEHMPPPHAPEIAFAGRSNVGKSSLVNALTGRNTLARTSNTPGRTQEINFFALGADEKAPALLLVDLPGYGYAKETRQRVEDWTRLVTTYLRKRANLRRVLLLIDSRHGIKQNDEEIMQMLDATAVSYQLVLTKTDKLKAPEVESVTRETQARLRRHVAAHPVLIATSSAKGAGIDLLRAEMAGLARTA